MSVEVIGTLWRSYKGPEDSEVNLYRIDGSPAVHIIHKLNGEETDLVLKREEDVLQFLMLITSNGFEQVFDGTEEPLTA